MNEIEQLQQKIAEAYPRAEFDMDKADNLAGISVLDVWHGIKEVNVMWSPSRRFGVSLGFQGDPTFFGEGPNEVVSTLEEAFEMIDKHLKS